MKSQQILSYIPLLCLSALSLLFLGAQETPVSPAPATPPTGSTKPHPLVWDAMERVYHAEPGETVANYRFSVTNASKNIVLISSVTPECGCTVADYPKPWQLKPGESGEITASMNFAGQKGSKQKTMKVQSSGGPPQVLTLKVIIPFDNNEERRKANMAAAAKDRQAVFKGDCASCHVEPLKGLMGEQLFVAGCNICHEPSSGHRAEIVPDLKKLAFPTDINYWKNMISNGKTNSLMPGFAKAHGGPLTDEEIDSLAQYAVKTFKFDPANVKKTN